MAQQLKDIKEDRLLDCKGLLCPMPVVKAYQAIKDLAPGQVLKVLATDPGSKADFPAWAEATGNRLLGQRTGQDSTYAYWIQKK